MLPAESMNHTQSGTLFRMKQAYLLAFAVSHWLVEVESLSELSPELVDQLLEHFVDPMHAAYVPIVSISEYTCLFPSPSLYLRTCQDESTV